jgi:hypothetical protein
MGKCRTCYDRDYYHEHRKKKDNEEASTTDILKEYYIDNVTFEAARVNEIKGTVHYMDMRCAYMETRNSPLCPNEGRYFDPSEEGKRAFELAVCRRHLVEIVKTVKPINNRQKREFEALRKALKIH